MEKQENDENQVVHSFDDVSPVEEPAVHSSDVFSVVEEGNSPPSGPASAPSGTPPEFVAVSPTWWKSSGKIQRGNNPIDWEVYRGSRCTSLPSRYPRGSPHR